jgi:hypothetical protein
VISSTAASDRVRHDHAVEVVGGDDAVGNELLIGEAAQPRPEGASGAIEQHDRRGNGLSGLLQGQQLEHLIERAEPARHADEAAGLLHEHELAGEEVLHRDAALVRGDDRVRLLLERQADRDAERVRALRLRRRPA